MQVAVTWPTCRGCGAGFICGGGVANTTEGGCPGGKEGCQNDEVITERTENVRIILYKTSSQYPYKTPLY